jgi:hypothetical protein
MANRSTRNPAPAAKARRIPATDQQAPDTPPPGPSPSPSPSTSPTPSPGRDLVVEEDPAPPPFDITTFDPDEFEWHPVPRRARTDGWTPDVQRRFIQALADTGIVQDACEAVDMSVASAYRLRNAPGSDGLRQAWDAAIAASADRLIDLAFHRAAHGVDEPVFDRDGVRIGSRRRYNDRLMMFLLRAYRPDRFRYAHRDIRADHEAAPPPPVAVATAMASLGPACPADPHRLLAPDRLEQLVDTARACADVHALYPRDDRERFAPEPCEPSHPAALDRARRRRARADAAEDRRWADGQEEGDDWDGPPFPPYGRDDL